MRAVRVIPCLDVDAGRVVKGVRFIDLVDAGDPVELAARYDAEGADELVFLDITASAHGRDTMVDVVSRTAAAGVHPLHGGWGRASARRRPSSAARRRRQGGVEHRRAPRPAAHHRAGRRVRLAVRRRRHRRAAPEPRSRDGRSSPTAGVAQTGTDAVAWAGECAALGAGEILVTSMDRDGTRDGFDVELTKAIVDIVGVPVVASGGVGNLDHLVEGATVGGADAVLAASIFHRREYTVAEAKAYLDAHGVVVRPPVA